MFVGSGRSSRGAKKRKKKTSLKYRHNQTLDVIRRRFAGKKGKITDFQAKNKRTKPVELKTPRCKA